MPTTTAPSQELDVLARLMDPETLNDPYLFYAWLREDAPVHRNPTGGVYLVSRNEAARTACQSPDGMTSRELKDGDPTRLRRAVAWERFPDKPGIAVGAGTAVSDSQVVEILNDEAHWWTEVSSEYGLSGGSR